MTHFDCARIAGTLSLAAAGMLAGCASTPPSTPDVPVNAGQVRFVLPTEVFGSSTDDELLRRYARALSDAGDYREVRLEGSILKGVEAKPVPTGVAVAYLDQGSSGVRHNYRANFGVKVSRAGTDVVLDVTCPETMKIDYQGGSIGLPWSPLIERPAAVADLKAMCSKALLKGNRREAGEVNVNYPDASVYANFARKLRPASQSWRESAPVSKDDLAKFKWFEVPDGKATRVVGITVFPYRSGSKVTYKWDNEALCKANAACQFDPAAAQRVQTLVASIAND